MRIILFTGKGGVGKTTTAAATAIQCAKEGKKTLVLSTDPAHSLSDALNIELSPEPIELMPNLWGQEFDVYYSMKKYWGNMREMMKIIFRNKGVNGIVAEELSVLPGMEEGAAFLWLEKFYREKTYDVIIIDSAPTGETLTLLSLPQVTKSWLTKAFPGQKFAIKTLGTVVRKTTGVPLDKGYEELNILFDKLESIQKVFLDPEITSIRIVANPERMVIQEAKRAYSYLQMYGYNVDAVIVNRIIPETDTTGVFQKYIASQKGYLTEIDESFAPIPIMKITHQGEEVFGTKLLEKIGENLYPKKNASAIFFKEKPFSYEEINDKEILVRMKVPFIGANQFTLEKYGDEILVTIGNQRRNIFLPKFAHFMELSSYHYENEWLNIKLEKKD